MPEEMSDIRLGLGRILLVPAKILLELGGYNPKIMNWMSMVLGGLKVQSKYLAVSKEIIGRIGIIMNKATIIPVRTLIIPPIS